MTIACPACRATNTERSCRRCKADLGLLFDLEARRQSRLAAAVSALRERDWHASLEHAHAAWDIRNGLDAGQLIACIHLLRGRFNKALAWHGRVACLSGEPT
jgi:hypothetical protein